MTVTDQRAPAPAATPPTEVSPTRPPQPGWRHPRRVLVVAVVVALGILVGSTGGYLAYQASPDPWARGRAADAARLQAQADAYGAGRAAVERGRVADAARLQAQADAHQARQEDDQRP